MARVLPRRGSSFTPLIKQMAVTRVHQGEPRKKIARDLGISEYMLHIWVCAQIPQPEEFVVALNLLKKGATRHAVRNHFGGQMPLSNLQLMKFKRR